MNIIGIEARAVDSEAQPADKGGGRRAGTKAARRLPPQMQPMLMDLSVSNNSKLAHSKRNDINAVTQMCTGKASEVTRPMTPFRRAITRRHVI